MVYSAGFGAAACGEFGVRLCCRGVRGQELDHRVPDPQVGEAVFLMKCSRNPSTREVSSKSLLPSLSPHPP